MVTVLVEETGQLYFKRIGAKRKTETIGKNSKEQHKKKKTRRDSMLIFFSPEGKTVFVTEMDLIAPVYIKN